MKKYRLSLDLTPEMKKIIEQLSNKDGITESELLRRTIALYWAIKKGMENGEEPAMIKKGEIVVRLVGI